MNLSVGQYNVNKKIAFFLGYDVAGGSGDPIQIASTDDFTDTTCWHLATVVVTDQGGGALLGRLYVDGVLEGSDTGLQNDRSLWDTGLQMGRPGAATRNFDGKMDDVRVYTRSRSAAEIAGLWHPGVLSNDADPENDALFAVSATAPAHGTVALNADGTFTYTPNANFNGTDSFTYKRRRRHLAAPAPVTVTITVNPVNDAPVATNDSYTTNEDTPLTVAAAAGVLANDTDVDGDPLHAVLVTGPAHGALTPQRRRLLHLHARRQLQRRRQLHLQGQRRQPTQQRRHGHAHRHRGQRRPGGRRRQPTATNEDTTADRRRPRRARPTTPTWTATR